MKRVVLPSGERVAAMGQGTWQLAASRATRAEEVGTLRLGLDLGASLIDTAEMYGEGAVEELVGEAIAGRRDEVFLVSKVYPHNASKRGTVEACSRSLRRLRTDRIDLYLLHWRGQVPIEETIEAFLALQQQGKIRHFGVSNFDFHDMTELWSIAAGGRGGGNEPGPLQSGPPRDRIRTAPMAARATHPSHGLFPDRSRTTGHMTRNSSTSPDDTAARPSRRRWPGFLPPTTSSSFQKPVIASDCGKTLPRLTIP